MENVDVWGVFDLEAPAEPEVTEQPQGEQEQEIADPADQGEQEQEIADPAEEEEEADLPDEAAERKPLTKAERAENAKRRRQNEIDAAVQAALEKERSENKKRWDKFFSQAQMKNQHQDGAVIDSLEKAEQWAEQDRMAKLQKNLQKGTLTTEDLQTALESSPAFQALVKNQQQAEQAAQQVTQAQFERDTQMQLEEIRKLDPSIETLADIIKKPQGREFANLVQKAGKDYLSAYKMAFHDDLVEQARKVAATGARVAAGGKEHLSRTAGRGTPAIEVPKEIREAYRVFEPDISDDEVQKRYEKWSKNAPR